MLRLGERKTSVNPNLARSLHILLLFFTWLLITNHNLLGFLDLWTYHSLQREWIQHSSPHPPPIILSIDKETIHRAGSFPLPRRYYTDILKNLREHNLAPKVLGIDIIFDLPGSDPAIDEELINEFIAHGSVVVARPAEASLDQGIVWPKLFPLLQKAIDQEQVFCGTINSTKEQDFLILSHPMAITLPDTNPLSAKQKNLPSLVLSMLARHEDIKPSELLYSPQSGIQVGDKFLSTQHTYRGPFEMLIDFNELHSNRIKHIPLWKLHPSSNEPIPSVIKDSFSFIGVEISNIDVHGTSLGYLPGVAVQADIADTALSYDPPKRITTEIIIPLAIFLLLFCALAWTKHFRYWFVILITIGFLLILSSYYLASQEGLWLPAGFLMATWICAVVFGFIERSSTTEKLLTQVTQNQQRNWDLNWSLKIVEGTVVTTDIREYTRLCEGVNPKVILQFLQDFHNTVSQKIRKYGGHIVTYQGDAQLIYFPISLEQEEKLQLLIQVSQELEEVFHNLASEHMFLVGKHFQCGLTFATGPLCYGEVGDESLQLQNTILGPTVRNAFELQDVTASTGVLTLFHSSLKEALQNQVTLYPISGHPEAWSLKSQSQ